MFRRVPLSIISSFSLYTQQWYTRMSYRFVDSSRAGPEWNSCSILVLLESCLQTCMTVPLLSVQWINSWRWTEELSETCRVLCQNKFVKLVHLVGFIIKYYTECPKLSFSEIHIRRSSNVIWTVGSTATWWDLTSHYQCVLVTATALLSQFKMYIKLFEWQMKFTGPVKPDD